jgi:hypothetical protein
VCGILIVGVLFYVLKGYRILIVGVLFYVLKG